MSKAFKATVKIIQRRTQEAKGPRLVVMRGVDEKTAVRLSEASGCQVVSGDECVIINAPYDRDALAEGGE